MYKMQRGLFNLKKKRFNSSNRKYVGISTYGTYFLTIGLVVRKIGTIKYLHTGNGTPVQIINVVTGLGTLHYYATRKR